MMAFLIPLLLLAIMSIIYVYVAQETERAFLASKYDEVKNEVGMIAAAANADPDDPWDSHEDNIREFMKFLDAKPFTFAAAYKPDAGELTLMTERDNATNLDPRTFDVFMDAIYTAEQGELVFDFTPEGMDTRAMHLYFEWVPNYSKPTEKYLLVAAVSRYSVTIKVPYWITLAPLVGVALAFLVCVWAIILKVGLGHVSGMRIVDLVYGKWRSTKRGG